MLDGVNSMKDAQAVFDRRRAAWLAEDVDGYLDCWVDDLVLETPGREPVRGRDAYEAMVRQSFAWAKPNAFEFHHIAVEGDIVFADWTISVERRHDAKVIEWRGMSVAGAARRPHRVVARVLRRPASARQSRTRVAFSR